MRVRAQRRHDGGYSASAARMTGSGPAVPRAHARLSVDSIKYEMAAIVRRHTATLPRGLCVIINNTSDVDTVIGVLYIYNTF